MSLIKFKRGLFANLPESAAQGEPLVTTDTMELYIGTGTGIERIKTDVVDGGVTAQKLDPSVAGEGLIQDTDKSLKVLAGQGIQVNGTFQETTTVFANGNYDSNRVAFDDAVSNSEFNGATKIKFGENPQEYDITRIDYEYYDIVTSPALSENLSWAGGNISYYGGSSNFAQFYNTKPYVGMRFTANAVTYEIVSISNPLTHYIDISPNLVDSFSNVTGHVISGTSGVSVKLDGDSLAVSSSGLSVGVVDGGEW